MENTVVGFRLVGGKEAYENESTKKVRQCYALGQEYTLLIKVRKSQVEAYLNNMLVSTLRTDFGNLSLITAAKLHRNDTLGVMVFRDAAIIESAEVIEIDGRGKRLR